ncbi:Uncharacterized protein Fot_28646 [Forsythia ovata]|uniref:Uncharacterized protein n=1 Tax=Forsythia ovata TaxID=205694 RepID=A0ABD1TPL2_9LAMI
MKLKSNSGELAPAAENTMNNLSKEVSSFESQMKPFQMPYMDVVTFLQDSREFEVLAIQYSRRRILFTLYGDGDDQRVEDSDDDFLSNRNVRSQRLKMGHKQGSSNSHRKMDDVSTKLGRKTNVRSHRAASQDRVMRSHGIKTIGAKYLPLFDLGIDSQSNTQCILLDDGLVLTEDDIKTIGATVELNVGFGDCGIFVVKYAKYIFLKKINEISNDFDTGVARHNMAVQLFKYLVEKPDLRLPRISK